MSGGEALLQRVGLSLLDRLERREVELLAWGCVDAAFSEEEIYEEAEAVLERLSEDVDVDELIDWLLERSWLWQVPDRRGGFRSRFAEGIRLFSRLRQIRDWGGGVADDAWRTSPALVADYRVEVRPRRFPRRDIDLEKAISQGDSGDWGACRDSTLRRDALAELIVDDSGRALRLSGFQVRATSRILGAVAATSRQSTGSTGTVICAGTGSGKTLAFYLPALAEIGARVDTKNWVKALAVYPRNELLKDQLREALLSARRLRELLVSNGSRPIAFGSLTGLVPRNPESVERGYSVWRPATADGPRGGPARVCPFLRCLSCNGELAWLDSDRLDRVERLVCLAPRCEGVVGGEELRLTRASMMRQVPDVLFLSTEMLNRQLSSTAYGPLLGLKRRREERPVFLLLDEIHDYEGMRGAQTAMLIRRWRHESQAPAHFVGLSATLEDAERFFADLVGLKPSSVRLVEPDDTEMDASGKEYLVALRGDPSSGAGLLSTTIQTAMLARRLLGVEPGDAVAGNRIFAFADDLDVINRLYFNLLDAEARDSSGRTTARLPLAFHRGGSRPMSEERLHEGQNWDVCERIGHDLGTRLNVARTSSQDQGVDPESDVVVATTSLEVGFDDPSVGSVIQHKAPPAQARFLQRKGRAGRTRLMRPWTLVVLSDFGRDRLQYQSYDQLFSPVLTPRYLPLSNRTMLRMQATYALFSWLSRTPDDLGLAPWMDLAGPLGEEGYARGRREHYLQRLTSLVEDDGAVEDLRAFLSLSLGLSATEVDALLWEPPRAVMLEAVPTLLRRLETDWKRAFAAEEEPQVRFGPPAPDFVQGQLFGELLTPEVRVVEPRDEGEAAELAAMKIVQALSEFSPGRVSRRFGIQTDWGHWADPGSVGEVDLDDLCPREARDRVRCGRYDEEGVWVEVPIIRPSCLLVARPPREIGPTSNAFPIWQTQVVASGGVPHSVDVPSGTPWTDLFFPLSFHTHHLGAPVEVRRFSTGSRVSLIRNGQKVPEFSVRYVETTGAGKERVALGFAADVDGLRFRYRIPEDLVARCASDEVLVGSLRPLYFRDRVRSDQRLGRSMNVFEREQLADGYLTAILDLAAGQRLRMESAIEQVFDTPELVDEVLELVALWSEDEAVIPASPTEDSTHSLPRRVRELMQHVRRDEVASLVQAHATSLAAGVDSSWDRWLQDRFQASLGAAARQAVLSLCPRTDPDALLVELRDGADTREGEACFWLVETSLGGAGALEEFHEVYCRDPRKFFRAIEAQLSPTDTELVAERLEMTLQECVVDGSSELGQRLQQVRSADSHEDSVAANRALRRSLAELGVVPEPTFLVSLYARVLRPGTGERTDRYLANLLDRWRGLEEDLGCEIGPIAMSVIASRDPGLEQALALDIPRGASPRVWRYSVLRGLLWGRGGRLREQCLRVENRFLVAPECDRKVVACVIGDYVPRVAIEEDEWFSQATVALAETGACDITGRPESRDLLARAIMFVATERLDTEGLRLHARLVGMERNAEGWSARLELPEAYQ